MNHNESGRECLREIDFEANFSVLKSESKGIGSISDENLVGFGFVNGNTGLRIGGCTFSSKSKAMDFCREASWEGLRQRRRGKGELTLAKESEVVRER